MTNQQGIVQDRIIQKLADALDLQHLEVLNESGNHNVPARVGISF